MYSERSCLSWFLLWIAYNTVMLLRHKNAARQAANKEVAKQINRIWAWLRHSVSIEVSAADSKDYGKGDKQSVNPISTAYPPCL